MIKRRFYISILLLFLMISVTQAQCYPDRHSTTWYDGWVSCTPSQNPNSAYGTTHWIMYDLGEIYSLAETKFWNANEPDNLDYGIQEFTIDFSLDGNTWENLGEFTLEQASGQSTYEGESGPDFEDNFARYVLITPSSNYGGDCFGLSEMKINVGDETFEIDDEDGFSAIVYPNPFDRDLNLKIVTLADGEPISYQMYDILGRQVFEDEIPQASVINYIDLSKAGLSSGLYILAIQHNGREKSFKLIRE